MPSFVSEMLLFYMARESDRARFAIEDRLFRFDDGRSLREIALEWSTKPFVLGRWGGVRAELRPVGDSATNPLRLLTLYAWVSVDEAASDADLAEALRCLMRAPRLLHSVRVSLDTYQRWSRVFDTFRFKRYDSFYASVCPTIYMIPSS